MYVVHGSLIQIKEKLEVLLLSSKKCFLLRSPREAH